MKLYYYMEEDEVIEMNKVKHKPSFTKEKDNYSLKILLLLNLSILMIFFFFIYGKGKHRFYSNLKFIDSLPRLSNKGDYIPKLSEIFSSKELFISDTKISLDYINYIRPIDKKKEESFLKKLYTDLTPSISFTKNRKNQINIYKYYNICNEEKLLTNELIKYNNSPLISVLLPSFNKRDSLLKSIRSIQNQSLKNIEIIIINDGSTDNSTIVMNYLLKTDPRIRVFHHLKNLGAWRSRLDAFLYSNAPYVIHFDTGDFYSDNFVLEDAYYLIRKYNLDSLRFSFKLSRLQENIDYKCRNFSFRKIDRKIVYGNRGYNVKLYDYGTIWNRLTRANIFTKGLNYLDEYILNAFKNLCEDRWWNTIANNASYSFLMVNRIGYIYLKLPGGAGSVKYGNPKVNESSMREYIYFWLFDYCLSYKKSKKKDIISKLHFYNDKSEHIKLTDLTNPFPPYEYLLDLLLNDTFIDERDKAFIKKLKYNYTKKLKTK